jgi:enamine deaminase RidA (YjgF/YER057c/UK114 family)
LTEITRLGGDPPSPYEGLFSFSRIACVGDFVLIGGATSVDENGVVIGVTPYEQAIEIFRKVAHELGRVGLGLDRVVQTRIYVTDLSRSSEVGRAHAEVFGATCPLMTMVGINALVDPRMLVEVETVAAR